MFLTQLQLGKVIRKIPIRLEIKKYNFKLLKNPRSMKKAVTESYASWEIKVHKLEKKKG